MVWLRLSAPFWLTDSHGSMLVAPNVAAMRHDMTIDGVPVVMEFRNKVGATSQSETPHVAIGIAVRHALVHVDFEVEAEANDFHEQLAEVPMRRAEAAAIAANATAREAVTRFRQWARTLHPWLAHPYAKPEQVDPAEVIVVASGRVLPLAPKIHQEHTGYGTIVGQDPISVLDMVTITESISTDAKPEIARQLLADARYLLHWSPVKDPPRAVIVAAIACEVNVKATLRAKAQPAAAPVLDVLLDNTRAFPQSALALFHNVATAVVGRSLRSDDKDLYKQVDELFQLRNRIAHHGHDPTIDDARAAIAAATAVFAWLDSLA